MYTTTPTQRKTSNFSDKSYADALLELILKEDRSSILALIRLQMAHEPDPVSWLYDLQSLLNSNLNRFRTIDATILLKRAFSSIEYLINELETENNTANEWKLIRKELDQISLLVEKLLFLHEKKAEYQQICALTGQCPDKLLQLIEAEIQKLKVLDNVKKEYKYQKENNSSPRICIRGKINSLVSAFFELDQQRINGEKFFQATSVELAKFIALHFADKDGHPISEHTVRTILSPNKIDKRPKLL